MKLIRRIIFGGVLLALPTISASAQIEENVPDTIVQESETLLVEETPVTYHSVDSADDVIESNKRFWKGSKKFISLGYTTGSFDLGGADGLLKSRWGATFTAARNIYVHRGPIGGFLKFGIFIGGQISYMNFEKGRGSLSDITGGGWEDYEDEEEFLEPTLGKHYLNAGLTVGPSATFLPFFASDNDKLARLKFRTYFNVVPSYSALILSDDDEADFNGAFTCLFTGGLQVIWRKLMIGVEWKGGRARYKSLLGDYDGIWVGNVKSPRLGCKMFTASIGLSF